MGPRALDVVDQMLSELQQSTQSVTDATLPSYEDAMSANDEIQDLGETQRKFRTLDTTEFNSAWTQFDSTMLQQAVSFTKLKEDLRRFVFPRVKSYIREVIEPLLPATKLTPIYTVAVRVHWEIEEYLGQEFGPEDDIDDIVTLTGDVACAQALPCGDYMRQSWPQTGEATLAAVKHALQKRSSCESHKTSIVTKIVCLRYSHAPPKSPLTDLRLSVFTDP